MDIDEQSIRQVHSTWINAVNSGDLAHLFTLMTDDIVFFSPGQAPLGRQDFPAGFLAAHQQFRVSCVSEPEEIAVAGEVAYTLCKDSLTITRRAGGDTMKLAGYRHYLPQAAQWRLALGP